MITCVLADDEYPQRRLLEAYISKISDLELLKSCKDGLEVIDVLKHQNPQIIFLDIEMPGLNGLELAEHLRNKEVNVVFISAYSKYAVDSYNFNTIDYLLKPVYLERFEITVRKIKEKISVNTNKTLILKTDQKLQKINSTDIVYIEGLKEYVRYNLKDGSKYITLESLKNIEQELSALGFVRSHKSYIINMNFVNSIEQNIVKINNIELPLGSTYKLDLITKFKSKFL